ELLMQRGIANDFSVGDGEQRKVTAEVNIQAPVANNREFGDAMFDEHAFLFGHGEEELVKFLFVVLAQRPQCALELVLEDNFLRKLLDFKFERHKASWVELPKCSQTISRLSTPRTPTEKQNAPSPGGQ